MYELPYGNTQQLNLDWFIKRWNEFYAQWQEAEAGIDHALDAEVQRVEDAMQDLYAARDAAAASATAAAASASSASNDATTATNAATAAAASATLANSKATAAAGSEAAAANSANSASISAIAAGTSASQANASAASATASEQSATASATAAAGSASDAADSASDAADSATEAAASAQEAQDVLDSIPEDYSELSNEVEELSTAFITPIDTAITAATYQTELPNADNAENNSVYRIFISQNATTYTANLPPDFIAAVNRKPCRAILLTLGTKTGNPYKVQYLFSDDNIYRRFKLTTNGAFSSWTNFNDRNINEYFLSLSSSNYPTYLPTLDNAVINTFYTYYFAPNNVPTNFPGDSTLYNSGIIITFGSGTYKTQCVYNRSGLFFRTYTTSWNQWINICDLLPKVYTVTSNDNLVATIEEAINSPNSTIYVTDGTFDIIDEYQTLHPTDWITRNDGRGVNINNGLTIIFGSKTKIICHYSGTEESVLSNFSAFNIRYSEATLIGLNVDCTNVRYCVHDDFYTLGTRYRNRYINCNMKINNSQNQYRSQYPHCIGGGFGQNADIEIDGCIFEGIGGDGTTNPAPTDNAIVSWHNTSAANGKSKLILKNSYFKGSGSFRAMCNGTSTEKSTLLLSSNSFGSTPIKGYSQGQAIDNMEVLETVNTVRT